MDLMGLLAKAGGNNSVGQLAGAIGIGESQTKDLVGALAPALLGGLQKQTQSVSGLAGLQSALSGGTHQRYVEQPELLQSAETREDGNKILGHILGSKDASRNVAAQAAQQTGIDPGVIKKALPLLASLAMGALSKSTNGGTNESQSAGGGLGAMLGGLLGGSDSNDSGLGQVLGMAKKLF